MKLRKLNTISASSISTFLDCNRKWFLRYIVGERPPPSPAMLHGTKVHDDIEKYLKGERSSPTMQEGAEALARGYIPDPSSVENDLVEYKAQKLGLNIHGLRLLGYLDLVQIVKGDLPIRVTDWKTRSRFDYAPSSTALADDIQAKLYAWIGFKLADARGIECDEILFRHVNMIRVDGERGRHSPKSMQVGCTIRRDSVQSWIDGKLKAIVGEMKAVAAIEDPREVKINSSSCYKYGPCEYKSPIKKLRGRTCDDLVYRPKKPKKSALPKERKMGLSDLLANDRKKKPAAKPKPKPAAKPAAKPGAAGDDLERAKADFLAKKAKFSLGDYGLSHADKRAFVLWRKDQAEQAKAEQANNPIPPVNPPDAAPDEQPQDLDDITIAQYNFTTVPGVGPSTAENISDYLSAQKITELADLLDHDLTKIDGVGPGTAKKIEAAIKAEKVWSPEGVDAPAQPTKTTHEAADGADVDDQHELLAAGKAALLASDFEAASAARSRMSEHTKLALDNWAKGKTFSEPEPEPEPKREKASTRSILYIDCRPTKGSQAVALEDLLEQAKAVVAEEEGVRYWDQAAYAKGQKLLVDVVLEDPSFLVDARHVYARSDTSYAKRVLPELRRFFDLIVEG